VEQILSCPVCHATLPPNSYYCFNCGKKLQDNPLTLINKVKIYAISVLVPPFGLWYLYKYSKFNDAATKKVGKVAGIVTIISLIVTVWSVIALTKALTIMVNRQLDQTYSQYGL